MLIKFESWLSEADYKWWQHSVQKMLGCFPEWMETYGWSENRRLQSQERDLEVTQRQKSESKWELVWSIVRRGWRIGNKPDSSTSWEFSVWVNVVNWPISTGLLCSFFLKKSTIPPQQTLLCQLNITDRSKESRLCAGNKLRHALGSGRGLRLMTPSGFTSSRPAEGTGGVFFS